MHYLFTDTITIIQSPQSVTVAVGNMLNLSITVKGAGNLMYQWKKEDSKSLSNAATGERSSNLIVRSVTTSDNGSYYCVVMNEWGNMVKSDKAIVKVLRELFKFYIKMYWITNRCIV